MRVSLAIVSALSTLLLLCSLVFGQNTVINYDVSGKYLPKSLTKGEIQYYLVNTTSWGMVDGDFVTLSLNSLSGDCDMWISTVEYPKTACADCLDRDSNGFGDVRLVYYNSTDYGHGIFYVGIIAQERAADYTFIAWRSNEIIKIEKNEIVFAESPRGKKNVFSFDIPSQASLITVSVNGIFGDPDLYISGSNGESWTSEYYGFDALKIHVVPGLTQLNVTVVAFSEAVYSIVVNVNDESIRLPEGVFVRDVVHENEMDTFLFRSLEPLQNIVVEAIEVKNEEGEAKLYIRKGAKPTTSEFDYVIALSGDDTYTVKDATAGDYYIGVYGLMNHTNYKVWAFGENPLQIDLATKEFAQKTFSADVKSYTFKYINNDMSKTITATIKQVYGSSPINVYAALFSRPSATKYSTKAVASGSSLGVLKFDAPSPHPFIYFTVAADSGEFTIEITTTQTIMALNDGEEVYLDWVPRHSYRYFSFVADKFPSHAVSITTKPSTGDVDIYVSTTNQYPTVDDHQWYADVVGVDTVYIPAHDEKAAEKKIFYIAVYAYESDSYFSIAASQVGVVNTLSEGHAVSSSVLENAYSYYTLTIKTAGKVYINLNLLKSGDEADIFYSTTIKTPNRHDYEGRSINVGNDVLMIEDAIPGEIYISVYGVVSTDSTTRAIAFTLSVATDYLNIFPNGDAVLINATKGSVSHFRADITTALRILTASATLISGKTAMYISTNGEKANSTNHVWSDHSTVGNSVLIKQTDIGFTRGIWYIAVQAIEDSVFHMSLASNIGATVLQNVPTLGRTAPDGNMDSLVYSFWLPFTEASSAKDVYIHIKELDHNVDVFINQDMHNDPTPKNHTWQSLSNGEIDRVVTLHKSSLALGKAVFVSIVGKQSGKSSLFTIEFRFTPHHNVRHHNTLGIIIGCSVGGAVLLIIVALVVFGVIFACRKKKSEAAGFKRFDHEAQQDGANSMYYKVENQ